jgi:glycosyltransferase involved in cell wall biosynthesis
MGQARRKDPGRIFGMMLLIRSLESGGAERVCVTLANAFVECGEPVELVLLKPGGEAFHGLLDGRVRVTILGVEHARNSAAKIYAFLSKSKPGRILVFNHQLAVILVLIKPLLALKPRIIARNISNLSEKAAKEKSTWHKVLVPFILKLFYQRVDAVICQSKGMFKDLSENFHVPDSKMVVINNPLAPELEAMARSPRIASQERCEMLFVGRFDPVKGLESLLEAFGIIALRNRNVKLILVGDGPLREGLERKVGEMGLSGRVCFEGYQKNVSKYYLRSKVTVLTSHFEGFPNVLLESISLGTPVVSFNCPSGPAEIVVHGVNGFLVPPGDIEGLAERIIHILENEMDSETVKKTALKFRASEIIPRYMQVLLSP